MPVPMLRVRGKKRKGRKKNKTKVLFLRYIHECHMGQNFKETKLSELVNIGSNQN